MLRGAWCAWPGGTCPALCEWWCRALQVALVHDLAEAVVGDITPDQGVSEDDKHARERVRPHSFVVCCVLPVVQLMARHAGWQAAMELFEQALGGHPAGTLFVGIVCPWRDVTL